MQGLDLLYLASQAPERLIPVAKGAAADLHGLPGVWAAVGGGDAGRGYVGMGGEAMPLGASRVYWLTWGGDLRVDKETFVWLLGSQQLLSLFAHVCIACVSVFPTLPPSTPRPCPPVCARCAT